MRPPSFTMLMALLIGILAFLSTRVVQNHLRDQAFAKEVAALEHNTKANLAWMRKELSLTDEEFIRECAIHDAHKVEYSRLCIEMNTARERLKQALQNNKGLNEDGQAAIRDYETHFEACEHAVIQHVKKVAAAMNPKSGQAYMRIMLPHLFPAHESGPINKASTPNTP